MPGTLKIKPIQANLIHDTAVFSKMDPYCKFSVGNQKAKSEVCKDGGTHPIWKKSIEIPLNIDQSKCLVEIRDENLLKDQNIGSCEIDISEVKNIGQVTKWYSLEFDNRKAGDILLELSYQTGTISGKESAEWVENELARNRMEYEGGSPVFSARRA